jgi:hypothetical protein
MPKHTNESPKNQTLDVDSIQFQLPKFLLQEQQDVDPRLMYWIKAIMILLGKITDYNKERLVNNIRKATTEKEIASAVLEVVTRRLDREVAHTIKLRNYPKKPLVGFTLQENIHVLSPQLTPQYLTSTILPYLNAIAEIQITIDEILSREPREIAIRSITQNSPISVSLDGASEAIKTIQDNVVIWRRENAKILAQQQISENEVTIEVLKAETLEKRANAAKSRAEAEKISAEAEKQRQETERLRLENQQTRVEIERAKVQLAFDILDRIDPNIPATEKITYVIKLLSPLDVIAFSKLEISVSE